MSSASELKFCFLEPSNSSDISNSRGTNYASHPTSGVRELLYYQDIHILRYSIIFKLCFPSYIQVQLALCKSAFPISSKMDSQWELSMPPIPIGWLLSKFLTNVIYFLSPYSGCFTFWTRLNYSCWNTVRYNRYTTPDVVSQFILNMNVCCCLVTYNRSHGQYLYHNIHQPS